MLNSLNLFIKSNLLIVVIILSLFFGVYITLAIVSFFNKKKTVTLLELDEAAKLLVRKDREYTGANNELLVRNKELNEMTKILIGRDLELSRSNERLMEADELKSKFVATAAHQLRTPLTAIKWSLNELVEGDFGKVKKEQKKIIDDVIVANNRLISLVNDLLDISRLEEGREIFDMKKQSIVPMLREI